MAAFATSCFPTPLATADSEPIIFCSATLAMLHLVPCESPLTNVFADSSEGASSLHRGNDEAGADEEGELAGELATLPLRPGVATT
uniref:Putative secreted protein n=1 Tax=Ixodes ricinus TaxID=34613 RepID=A0A6B0UAY8_IXORI